MYLRILKKDIKKKKIITIVVFIFIMLSALLISSAANMILDLSSSLDNFMKKSDSPDYLQQYTGTVDYRNIDDWTKKNDFVAKKQIVKTITINNSNIFINNDIENESASIIDSSFVKQNEEFDFLLDLSSEKIKLNDGEIAVPIYFKETKNLKIGDYIDIKTDKFNKRYIIKDFVRDFLMNPSIINSKRFVISDNDFDVLEKEINEFEYLIEFQLKENANLSTFKEQYLKSNLPKGLEITKSLLITMNMLTDGLVIAVIILISLLLSAIALFCLRFTILSTIEEDYKEIGVMKAIGFKQNQVKRIYLIKYIFLAFSACITGYFLSLGLNNTLLNNILLYIGEPSKNTLLSVVPFLSIFIIFILIISFCSFMLRKFKKVSVIDSLRMGSRGETYTNKNIFSIHRGKLFSVNILIGLRDIFIRFKSYVILLFVFIICTSIIIIPTNLNNTINSDKFITYMGKGNIDLLIRQSGNVKTEFEKITAAVKNDDEVVKYAPLITCQYKVISDNEEKSILIETGDFNKFPINYKNGKSPLLKNEISLSCLNASELGKDVGDELIVIIDNKKEKMIVSGIYQDITNGGRTAKANINPDYKTATWYSLNIKVNGDLNKKIKEYKSQFTSAKVTDVKTYLEQTLKTMRDKLDLTEILAIFIAVAIAILITSLFIKLLITKDSREITIMKNLGFKIRDIQIQYITRVFTVLNTGIIIGTILSNTLGEFLVGRVLKQMQGFEIEFIINPLNAYMICPVILISAVTLTTIIISLSIKEYSIYKIQAE